MWQWEEGERTNHIWYNVFKCDQCLSNCISLFYKHLSNSIQCTNGNEESNNHKCNQQPRQQQPLHCTHHRDHHHPPPPTITTTTATANTTSTSKCYSTSASNSYNGFCMRSICLMLFLYCLNFFLVPQRPQTMWRKSIDAPRWGRRHTAPTGPWTTTNAPRRVGGTWRRCGNEKFLRSLRLRGTIQSMRQGEVGGTRCRHGLGHRQMRRNASVTPLFGSSVGGGYFAPTECNTNLKN